MALFKAVCINIFQATITYVCICVHLVTVPKFGMLLEYAKCYAIARDSRKMRRILTGKALRFLYRYERNFNNKFQK